VLAEEAGFPRGSVNVTMSLSIVAEVSEGLCTNLKVHKVSFTGSMRFGKLLMEHELGARRKQPVHGLR
jgi:succinate-semialdehyde dehydrogenase/glutarate-semialdehyde dehydrogenase